MYTTVAERLLLPLGDRLLHTELMRTLRRWRVIQHATAPELAAMQAKGLAELLRHATSEIPYHRDLRLVPDADPYAWLSRFPVTTKRTLREEGDRMVSGDPDDLIAAHSSGSSGVRSTVYMTAAEASRSIAYQTLFWEWAGYRLGEPLLQTGITPDRGLTKRMKDILLRTTYLDAFGVSDTDAQAILSTRSARTAHHFGGYASSLYVFARAAARAGIDDITFDSVLSWGDKMFPEYRRLIEEQFSTKVFDSYGCTEGMMIAGQYDLDQYYVLSPHVVVELLDDDDRPVPKGTLGRVVVTRLDSRAMPLVRYALGDLAVEGTAPPGARLAFPVLDRIVGRDTDLIRTPRGNNLVVHTFTGIFEFVDEIEQFRIVQRDLAGIEIEYIPGRAFAPEALSRIEARLRQIVDEPFEISFVEVSEIAATGSGKPQIVASYLAGAPPGTNGAST